MPTVTYTYFDGTTANGWTNSGTLATNETIAWDTANGSSITGHGGTATGSLKHEITGKGGTSTAYPYSTLVTLSSLGVPANSTITGIQVNYDWSCVTYAHGGGNKVLLQLQDASSTVLASSGTHTIIATTAWATDTTLNATGLTLHETNTIQLVFADSVNTSTSGSGTFDSQLNYDHVVLTITYTTVSTDPFPLVYNHNTQQLAVIRM